MVLINKNKKNINKYNATSCNKIYGIFNMPICP